LHPKYFSTWVELCYWFKSTYGQPQSLADLLKSYNNLVYNKGETIKAFNLCFTKLYNQILKIIRPHNQAALMHYYNAIPPSFHHILEEKSVNNLGSTLQTCLEYEEKITRIGLPMEDLNKQIDMHVVLQLIQYMSN